MRVYQTFIEESGASTIIYEGGGVNAIIFSLQFLWEEYTLFHNSWSETNDGHDLARYFGTTIYLPPHRWCDYIFWFDRDWQKYTNEHFLRCHPVNLFSWKNKVFIRSQNYGQNTKTKKIKIRPPATLTNQWRHMKDWFYIPLFAWGISVIDWNKFFSRGKIMPYCPLPKNEIRYANYTTYGTNYQWQQPTEDNWYYNSYYDQGTGNSLWLQVLTKTQAQDSTMPHTSAAWREVTWARDLPYWMTFYAQNKCWDMGVIKKTEYKDENNLLGGALFVWFRIGYPKFTSIAQANTMGGSKKWIAWKLQLSLTEYQPLKININYGLAYTGPFAPTDYNEQIEIPILYKSKWQWGGQTWSNMEIINPGHFTKASVTVKNPYTVARSIIYPGDTGPAGLLTDEALERFIRPSSRMEERRPQPWAGLREEDPYKPDYSESGSEAEETEAESDGECDEKEAVRSLKRRLQREQYKRRQFFQFLKSLLKSKRLQEREGAEPPPPHWGPPSPNYGKWE